MSQPDARTHAQGSDNAARTIDDTRAAAASTESISCGPMALTLAIVLLVGTLGLLFSPARTGTTRASRATVSSSRQVDAVFGFSITNVSGSASSGRVGRSTAPTSRDRS